MASLFDGMTGILNSFFGEPVNITPPHGPDATLQGIFRDSPVEDASAMGRPYGVSVFTLQLQKPRSPAVVADAVVERGDGSRYRVLGIYADRSPAADAFEIVELEPLTQ